jgi:hypothetical protein
MLSAAFGVFTPLRQNCMLVRLKANLTQKCPCTMHAEGLSPCVLTQQHNLHDQIASDKAQTAQTVCPIVA